MLNLLDRIPNSVLVPLAIILLLAPFKPAPHVLEKLIMLKNGALSRPLDVFDLIFHLLPAMGCVLKLIRWRRRSIRPGG